MPQRTSSAIGKQNRILLAEDTPENQVLARQCLEGAGYHLDIADNGALAVAAFKKGGYDLVLMDIQMPVMDGFEAARQIRSLEHGGCVPIIAFTALSPGPHRSKCIEAGMDDFIQKPFEKTALLSMVAVWLAAQPVILVVDDIEESRRIIERLLLSMKKYRIATAANGVEAIRAVKDLAVSLILMDMEMPVMDGYTASRAIKNLGIGPAIPVIAMTAHEGESERQKCLKAGCADYLHKPVRRDRLFSIVKQYLGNGPSPDTAVAGRRSGCGPDIVHIDPDLQELVPGYLRNREADTKRILQLLSDNDLEEVRRLGHSMSGSGGGYGFHKISRFGKQIEKAAEKKDPREIRKIIDRLAEYLTRVTVVMKNGN
ncbi:MAG: response regulator [Nitrospirae bacterium]|nr:MAG: response regulator [Nitrospirota bacterium]